MVLHWILPLHVCRSCTASRQMSSIFCSRTWTTPTLTLCSAGASIALNKKPPMMEYATTMAARPMCENKNAAICLQQFENFCRRRLRRSLFISSSSPSPTSDPGPIADVTSGLLIRFSFLRWLERSVMMDPISVLMTSMMGDGGQLAAICRPAAAAERREQLQLRIGNVQRRTTATTTRATRKTDNRRQQTTSRLWWRQEKDLKTSSDET